MRHTEPVVLPHYELLGPPLGPHDGDTLDVEAIIRFIRGSWRLCVIWIGAGLCAGIVFWVVSPAYYTAYSTLLFYDNAPRSAAASSSPADAVASAYVDTQIQVLQSDEVVGRVVDQNRLIQSVEFGVGDATPDAVARHATILQVERALTIGRIGLSDAVTVAFTSRNRLRSAAIANAITQSYIDARSDLQQRERTDTVVELRKRLEEARNKAFVSDAPNASVSATPQSAEQARARFHELQDNADAYRAMYDNLLQRANTASAAEYSGLGVRVITPAEPPLKKSWPRLLIVFGIAAAAAGMGGIAHAFLRQMTDRSLRTAEDVRRSSGLDCIAGVPKIEEGAWVTGGIHPEGLQPAYVNASAIFCQSLVRLAFRLQGPQKRPRIIGVAAPTSGVGTSSVAVHLANILAESGRKTLLVDANWQKPSVGLAVYQSDANPMLARVLAAIHLEPGRLDILVLRATAPISPLNASLAIVSALQHLPGDHDCVVVDFHAADQTADLEASMTIINEAVVVVEAGRTTAESLYDLLRVLPKDKLQAVIMNKTVSEIPGLRTEFVQLVEALARRIRSLLLLVPSPLLDRLAAWRADWAQSIRTELWPWLCQTARSARRQLR